MIALIFIEDGYLLIRFISFSNRNSADSSCIVSFCKESGYVSFRISYLLPETDASPACIIYFSGEGDAYLHCIAAFYPENDNTYYQLVSFYRKAGYFVICFILLCKKDELPSYCFIPYYFESGNSQVRFTLFGMKSDNALGGIILPYWNAGDYSNWIALLCNESGKIQICLILFCDKDSRRLERFVFLLRYAGLDSSRIAASLLINYSLNTNN
jgi:hypothetical protein